MSMDRYKVLTKEYILAHQKEIIRRVDVLVLYISAFRKIFEKNIGLVNNEIIHLIVNNGSAVRESKSYLNEYLNAIKDGFEKAAGNSIVIKQDNILLNEINLENFSHHDDIEFKQISDALIKTARDVSALGRAFGNSYITSKWDNKDYQEKKSDFLDAANSKDRYLVDVFFYDNIGYAELSIISHFNLGQ
jgi:hypothetical protein